MKVWRSVITRNETNQLNFHGCHEVDIPDEVFDKFKWDRLNVIEQQEHGGQLLIFSDSEQRVRDVETGMSVVWEALYSWDKLFNEETKQKALALNVQSPDSVFVRDGSVFGVKRSSITGEVE